MNVLDAQRAPLDIGSVVRDYGGAVAVVRGISEPDADGPLNYGDPPLFVPARVTISYNSGETESFACHYLPYDDAWQCDDLTKT
jgi:hypothetical protein